MQETQETQVQSLVRKILWRRNRQPISVFLSGEFHGESSLVDYSPWGHKESDKADENLLQRVGNSVFCGDLNGKEV